MDGLSYILSKHMECLNYHCGGSFESVKSYSKLDVIGKLLLDNKPNSSFNLRNLVLALFADDNVKTIV